MARLLRSGFLYNLRITYKRFSLTYGSHPKPIKASRESTESNTVLGGMNENLMKNTKCISHYQEYYDIDEIVRHIYEYYDNEKKVMKAALASSHSSSKSVNDSWLFYPHNYWKRLWDTIIFLLVMILCVVEPFDLAMNSSLETTLASKIAQVFFIADMLASFNTILITDTGEAIYSRLTIAKIYLSFWFWFDFIALIPSIVFGITPISYYQRLSIQYICLSLLRLVRITRVPRIINRFSLVSEINPNLISFITRISVITIAFHWTACLYWLSSLILAQHNAFYNLENNELADFLHNRENSTLYYYVQFWLPPRELLFFNVTKMTYNIRANQYLWSLFFSIMVTTGSGRDIKPTTESEYLVSIFCVLVGLIIFAYIVSGVTALLNSQDDEEALLRQSIFGLESFFKKHPSIPQSQRVRTKDWLLYRYSRTGFGSQRYDELLGDLPASLALEIKVFLRKPIIDKLQLFKAIDNALCIIDLIDSLEIRLLLPGENVYEKGAHPDGFYILVQGVLKEKKTEIKLMKTIRAISMFGVDEMVLQMARLSTIVSATHAETLKLTRTDYSAMTRKYCSFQTALTSVVCGKKMRGWDKVRQTLRIARTNRFVGLQKTDMEFELLKPKQNFPFGMYSASELYQGKGRAFQYFVYKKSKAKELECIKHNAQENSCKISTTTEAKDNVFEMKCKRRTLASKLRSRASSIAQ